MHSNRRGLLPPTRAFSLSIVYLRLSTLESTMHIKWWVDMNLGHLSEKFINQRVDWLAKISEYYEIVDSSSHHAMARVRHCCLLVCVVSSLLRQCSVYTGGQLTPQQPQLAMPLKAVPAFSLLSLSAWQESSHQPTSLQILEPTITWYKIN